MEMAVVLVTGASRPVLPLHLDKILQISMPMDFMLPQFETIAIHRPSPLIIILCLSPKLTCEAEFTDVTRHHTPTLKKQWKEPLIRQHHGIHRLHQKDQKATSPESQSSRPEVYMRSLSELRKPVQSHRRIEPIREGSSPNEIVNPSNRAFLLDRLP